MAYNREYTNKRAGASASASVMMPMVRAAAALLSLTAVVLGVSQKKLMATTLGTCASVPGRICISSSGAAYEGYACTNPGSGSDCVTCVYDENSICTHSGTDLPHNKQGS